jgi:branched-chain amino acid transport system permease protein
VQTFLETLINGLAVGSLYALIALGYTMVYGILKFINFAHSDVFVLGAWLSLTFATAFHWAGEDVVAPWWGGGLILILAMVGCGVVGFTIERLAYRPLRSYPKRMPAMLVDRVLTTVQGVPIRLVDVIAASTAIILMFGLEWLVYHTKLGRAMRAVSFSERNAALMGIPVDRVISFTFVLGSMLAAAAGFLYSMKYPVLNQPAYSTWLLLGLKAFVAAVVGGIGNIRGAMLGGFFIALIEFFGVAYVSTDYRDVYVFALLILVLLLKPSGLLGKAVAEKV